MVTFNEQENRGSFSEDPFEATYSGVNVSGGEPSDLIGLQLTEIASKPLMVLRHYCCHRVTMIDRVPYENKFSKCFESCSRSLDCQ